MTYTPEKITEIRESLLMTQGEFANLLGFSRGHINRVEHGQREVSRLMKIELDKLKAEVKQ